MAVQNPVAPKTVATLKEPLQSRFAERLRQFPYWLLAIGLIIIVTFILITQTPSFNEAFSIIQAGISVTLVTTLSAYSISLILGLVTGLGRVSKNIASRNIASFYVEVMRGIPMLVSIFFIALVLVPGFVKFLSIFGNYLLSLGLDSIGNPLAVLQNRAIPMSLRAVSALSITYGAYSAEIFRAGIQSVHSGQMEAARSQGMSHREAMWHVILPQAIRNVLPALGNDFIAMLKDSSLVSILGVRDITQVARLYAGASFRFPEAYSTLSVMYLTMTLMLSMLVKLIERRISNNGQ